ncbi:MAG: type II toxin-antitoxin system VapC family toxin [Nitrospinae bacterium]|nr:type II toxin-antitoxin system VapC family toxin [Nitrospinota bacterium]
MTVVLDASALLAFLQDEPGGETVEEALSESSISAVNWAEVIQKADAHGVPVQGMREELVSLGLVIEPFDAAQGESVGLLWRKTARYGLSLGDRACLALALERGRAALTADTAWKRLRIGVDIRVIR